MESVQIVGIADPNNDAVTISVTKVTQETNRSLARAMVTQALMRFDRVVRCNSEQSALEMATAESTT